MAVARYAPVALTYLAIGACVALAGPLDPPAGPITSTHKTLTEVEPRTPLSQATTPGDADSVFKITQPGSYYLTGNVTGVSGKNGIEIAASGVTIDLSGFELLGVAGSNRGITASVTLLTNIEVRGGSVRAWGSLGVDLAGNGPANSVVRDLRVSNCGNTGINVVNGSSVINCVSANNTVNGITAVTGCLVSHCAALGNGSDGIELNGASSADACVSNGNGSDGFETSSGVVLSACSASNNLSVGINISSDCSVNACIALGNSAHGISAASGCVLADNACRSNGLDGIMVGSGCVISGNSCTNNGTDAATGAGIHVQGVDCRVEGNNCTGQDRGVDVDGAGNFIVRNTCSGNTTNWDIVANNTYGPIINRVGVATPAVTGDSAVEAIGSTHANANFTY